ncbi:MAG: hypothetical protein SWX82_27080, partial [Cyanobacteriota bacterium]|nr:hypothetical protein [Cyanobacteriota bacterium]
LRTPFGSWCGTPMPFAPTSLLLSVSMYPCHNPCEPLPYSGRHSAAGAERQCHSPLLPYSFRYPCIRAIIRVSHSPTPGEYHSPLLPYSLRYPCIRAIIRVSHSPTPGEYHSPLLPYSLRYPCIRAIIRVSYSPTPHTPPPSLYNTDATEHDMKYEPNHRNYYGQ